MHRLGGLAALILAVSVPLGSVSRGDSPSAEADLELARSSVRGGKSLEYVRGLTEIGPRLTGSAAVSAGRRLVGGSVPGDGDHGGLARAVHDRAGMGARVGARPNRGAGRSSASRGLARLVAFDAGWRTGGRGRRAQRLLAGRAATARRVAGPHRAAAGRRSSRQFRHSGTNARSVSRWHCGLRAWWRFSRPTAIPTMS